MVGPQLLREYIVKALEAMKLGKTEEDDSIPVEMIEDFGEKATAELMQICQQIWLMAS